MIDSCLSSEEIVAVLAIITTQDDAGAHFTQRFDNEILDELERCELIEIDRPTHPGGYDYGRPHWTVEVTPEGVAWVEAYPEYHPCSE